MAAHLLDVEELHRKLDARRTGYGLSWRQLAKTLDLTASTLTRLRAGGRPDADALVTMLTWLDIDLAYVTKARP